MKLQLLIALLFLPLLIMPFAYADEFYVVTDKLEYYNGDVLLATGEVSRYTQYDRATYSIMNSDGVIITALQLDIHSNASFNIEITLSEEFEELEEYTLQVKYFDKSTQTTFNIIPNMTNEALYDEIQSLQNSIQQLYQILSVLTGNIIDQDKFDLIQNFTSQIIINNATAPIR